jgi:RNA polymerase sigma-70 factor (ECF subfamily)
MLNMAYKMTGNLEEAKEVCQDALIKVFKYLNTYKKGYSFKNWLYKTVVNSTYDSLRKRKKQDQIVETQKRLVTYETANPEKRFLNKEIKEKISACLSVLTPKEKAIFLLRDHEGFSIKETSEILKSSSVSVRTHLSRARQKIRREFEKIYSAGQKEIQS